MKKQKSKLLPTWRIPLPKQVAKVFKDEKKYDRKKKKKKKIVLDID